MPSPPGGPDARVTTAPIAMISKTFCPFCGKEIQDADEVREKMDALDEES